MLTEDIKINLNTAEASAKNGVKKLIAIGGQWNYKSRTDRAIMESDYDHSFAGGSSGHDVSKYVLHSLLGYMKTEGKLNSTVLMIPLLYNETLTEDLNERHPLLHIVNNIAHAAKKKLQTIHLGSTQTNKRQLIHSSDLAKAAIMAMSIDTPLLNVAVFIPPISSSYSRFLPTPNINSKVNPFLFIHFLPTASPGEISV